MLRLLQTNALSDKVVKLFEALTPKSDFQAKTMLVEANRTSDAGPFNSAAPLSAARRRRLRRAPLVSASGSIRSSWF